MNDSIRRRNTNFSEDEVSVLVKHVSNQAHQKILFGRFSPTNTASMKAELWITITKLVAAVSNNPKYPRSSEEVSY